MPSVPPAIAALVFLSSPLIPLRVASLSAPLPTAAVLTQLEETTRIPKMYWVLAILVLLCAVVSYGVALRLLWSVSSVISAQHACASS